VISKYLNLLDQKIVQFKSTKFEKNASVVLNKLL